MKKFPIISFQLLIIFGVLALALPVLTASVSHAEPQTTPSDRNQTTGEQNPSQERSNLLNSYHQAIEMLSVMPEDIPVEFPLGTNSSIRTGQIPNDTGTPAEANNLIAQGFVDWNGQPHSFTSTNLVTMFSAAIQNGGNLPRINMTPETQENLLADAQGVFFQAKRIPVLDLIVRNVRTNRRYVVCNVNANVVERDALNAVLTRTLRRYNKISEEK
jgi:hypothetical protein